MKKILLLTLSMGLFTLANAQYWQFPNVNANTNPSSINNDTEQPSQSGWTNVIVPGATPTWSSPITIPFSFSFNGTPVTQVKASSTGIVTFDVSSAIAAPAATNSTLPSALIPDKSVCIWGIQGTGTNDTLKTKTFGTAPNRQFWIQYNSFSIASNSTAWNYWSVVLEETTNKIHIVDHKTGSGTGLVTVALTVGLQISSSSALSVAGSPALASTSIDDDTPADNSYYSFIPGVQPQYNAQVIAITNGNFMALGNNSITGSIKNLGTSTITSLAISYSIDGGAPVSTTLSGLNIPSFGTGNFTHPTPWNATIGAHTISVTSGNINGNNVDADLSNNTATKAVNILSESVTRIPLFEIFTSSTCPPCKPGNEQYHSVVDSKPKADFVTVKYQQDFPGTGDPYCTTEAVNRRTVTYGINSIPRMEIDGGWDKNASSFTDALYTSAKSVLAQYKMTGTCDVAGQNILTKVKFSPLFNATGAKLYVAVLESKTDNNVKSNGEVDFTQVMKKMLPTEAGTTLPSVAIGSWDSISLNFTFKGNYRLPADGATANRINHNTEHSVEVFPNLYAVAWIQAADKKVYQALNLTLKSPLGTESFSNAINEVKVFPIPASNNINVELNVKANEQVLSMLIDMTGNVISTKKLNATAGTNKLSYDVSGLANGIYNVIIFDSKNNSSVHEVLVQH